MELFKPRDPEFAPRVRASFSRQQVMTTLQARLLAVEAGRVDIELPYDERFTQQHGFLHAGIVATLGDSACGYAAFSLMPPDSAVLTVEYKINLMAPARGETFIARAQVLRPGRTITVSRGDVYAVEFGQETLIATLQASVMTLQNRPGLTG